MIGTYNPPVRRKYADSSPCSPRCSAGLSRSWGVTYSLSFRPPDRPDRCGAVGTNYDSFFSFFRVLEADRNYETPPT